MGKKDAKAEDIKPAADNTLKRDENGFGTLPGFEFVIPEEGLAAGAVVNGNEIKLINMYDDESTVDINPDNVSIWTPSIPDGEDWFLAAIGSNLDLGPWAMFARKAPEKATLTGKAYAAEFLLGALIKVASKHIKTLSKPWSEMKEAEQKRVLGYVHDDCRAAVRDAIDIIASNARLTFVAAVDQVVFKDGVKAVLTLAKTPEAHSLADAEGSYVTIVIEERSKLLDEGNALEVEKDQKPLFDASTEGTALDTEKEKETEPA